MKIIFGLLTFFLSITLLLCIALFIWSKFFEKDKNTMEAEKMKVNYAAEEDEAIIKEGKQAIS
jgi:hypothetical protein